MSGKVLEGARGWLERAPLTVCLATGADLKLSDKQRALRSETPGSGPNNFRASGL